MRETERRARAAEDREPVAPARTEIHPDHAAALAAAEDALGAALGRPVSVKAQGDGARVTLDFETAAEAIELAEQLNTAPGGSASRLTRLGPGATLPGRGRLAQSVRARL